jgi:NADH-quinone oxidoreductase subunit M
LRFSLIAVIYVGLVALVQRDMKKLVAYYVVHGFCDAGLSVPTACPWQIGIVQMIAHGFVSAAMFFITSACCTTACIRADHNYGGVVTMLPRLPPLPAVFNGQLRPAATAGFVGEWMVILGAVKAKLLVGMALPLISGAAYTLWMYKRVYLGRFASGQVKTTGRYQQPRVL